jgi:hypothetical protein
MCAKAGRPPKAPEDRRTNTISVPLTDAERAAIDAAVAASGGKLAEWARDVMFRAAKRKAASGERGS